MRLLYPLATCIIIELLASCAKEPAQEYKLTPEQLAWQPYRTGDVLRFGRANSSKLRTFFVEAVDDRLENYSLGGNSPVFLGPAKRVRVQVIDVRVRRTDTLRYIPTPTSTPARPDSISDVYARSLLNINAGDYYQNDYAYLNWDFGFSSNLPLNEVIAGRPLTDTTQLLLPTLRLGGIDYGPVLRLSNGLTSIPTGFSRNRPARFVYYAKGFGVVGFAEGWTLWYRLP